MDVRQWLIKRQWDLRESDRAFSRRLDISAAAWGYIRRGEQSITLRVVRSARRAFPADADTIASLALNEPTDCVEVA